MMKIDLGDLTNNGEVRNLSGHERGVAARAKFDLDALDKDSAEVVIGVPEDLYSVSPSFFQGMFAASVRACGNRDGFLKRFHFDAPVVVLRQIDSGIAASLRKRSSVLGG